MPKKSGFYAIKGYDDSSPDGLPRKKARRVFEDGSAAKGMPEIMFPPPRRVTRTSAPGSKRGLV